MPVFRPYYSGKPVDALDDFFLKVYWHIFINVKSTRRYRFAKNIISI